MAQNAQEDPDMLFWEEQYQSELSDPFDWFFSFHDQPFEWWQELLGPLDTRILMLGCGHSKLSEDLYAAGYHHIVSLDSSESVIEMMRGRAPHMRWIVGDARDLRSCLAELHGVAPYGVDSSDSSSSSSCCGGGNVGNTHDPEFDIVLDKGLLDALLVYRKGNAWTAGTKAAGEAAKVLRRSAQMPTVDTSGTTIASTQRGGKFVIISCLRAPIVAGEEEELARIQETQPKEIMGHSATESGLDGYGGGRAKAFYCLEAMNNSATGDFVWDNLSYKEVANPRKAFPDNRSRIALSEMEHTSNKLTEKKRGSIAPIFEDVQPTHYALIVAERARLQHPLRDSSLDDYDALYTGSLDGTNQAPEPHDAFISWEALKKILFSKPEMEELTEKQKLNMVDRGDGGLLTRYFPGIFKQRSHGTCRVKNFTHPFRILEVGVGTSCVGAGLIDSIQTAGAIYVGVDAVPSAIALQKQYYPDQRLFVADARDLAERHGATMLRDWFGEVDTSNVNEGYSISGLGKLDLIFDKGTADALFLYQQPEIAISAYLRQVSMLLRPKDVSSGEIEMKHRGIFLVVSCARVDGILNGHGKPLLLKHIEETQKQKQRRLDHQGEEVFEETPIESPGTWEILFHRELLSDVGAGDRTYDLIALSLL